MAKPLISPFTLSLARVPQTFGTSSGMRTMTQPRFEGMRSSVALKDFATGLGFGFLELAAQGAEAQRSALRLHAVMSGNEGAQPSAVDECDVVHVEDNFLFSFGDQAFYLFAQGIAFLAENDSAVQRHHGHAIHFAVCHLQSHVIFLLIGKRFRRQPGPEP